MNQMSTCNVKGVAHRDEFTENDLRLPPALQSVLASFKIILLLLQPVTLMFRLSLTALVIRISSCSELLF